jgi:DNA-binding NarL/FixJ family response regulator
MEFDRSLTVALVDESELVVAGTTAMLAPYAGRVDLVAFEPGSVSPDLVLHDPFARHRPGAPGPDPRSRSRVVVYTWENRPGLVSRALAKGVSGFVSKALPASELVVALEKVHLGERLVALDYEDDPTANPSRHLGLTPRESAVMGCIVAGMSNAQIAARLHVSMNTVKSHIRTAYQTMGVTSRTQALLWALEHGVSAA